jgi:hypothetical protein
MLAVVSVTSPLVRDPGPAAAAHPYIDPRSLNPHYLARPMIKRIDRPKCWGPLTPADLLSKLAAEYNRVCGEAAQSGRYVSPAALIAWQRLRRHCKTGKPPDPSRLPFHAQQVTKRLQIARVWL